MAQIDGLPAKGSAESEYTDYVPGVRQRSQESLSTELPPGSLDAGARECLPLRIDPTYKLVRDSG